MPDTFRREISLLLNNQLIRAEGILRIDAGRNPLYSLDIRDLELVMAIAEEGTVTAAGARLHLTQSALSHRLKDVESRLGVPLFVRTRRRMAITPAGESVLASARRVLDEIGRVQIEIRRMHDEIEQAADPASMAVSA